MRKPAAKRGIEVRRFPRVRARCRVEVRDRFVTWVAETEDVSPRGCRLLTGRPPTVGSLLRLSIASDHLLDPLEVAGQVVWTRRAASVLAGISFAGSPFGARALTPAAWFEMLAAGELGVEVPVS